MSYESDLRDRLARIETKLDILVEDYAARVKDHEERLRGLEKWRYALPTSVILAVASILASVFHNVAS